MMSYGKSISIKTNIIFKIRLYMGRNKKGNSDLLQEENGSKESHVSKLRDGHIYKHECLSDQNLLPSTSQRWWEKKMLLKKNTTVPRLKVQGRVWLAVRDGGQSQAVELRLSALSHTSTEIHQKGISRDLDFCHSFQVHINCQSS